MKTKCEHCNTLISLSGVTGLWYHLRTGLTRCPRETRTFAAPKKEPK